MSDLTLYNFEQMPVRIAMRDGEPWFLAPDVATVLGYKHAPHMVRMLDEDEKGVQIVDTLGGQQQQSIISESGLYAAILKSRRPEAKRFRRWVTGEVLPAIRRTGRYDGPKEPPKPSVPDRLRAYLLEREIVSIEGVCDDLGLAKDNNSKAAIAAMLMMAGWRKYWVCPVRRGGVRRIG